MYKSIHCRICTLYVPSYGANHSLTLRYALLCSLLNHKCSPLHTGLCPPVAMLWWMTPTTPSLTTQSGPGWSTKPSHNLTHPPATKWSLWRFVSMYDLECDQLGSYRQDNLRCKQTLSLSPFVPLAVRIWNSLPFCVVFSVVLVNYN